MGLFSSSKSSSTTSYLTENNDRRVAVDGQSQGISGDGNSLYVQATDYGAILQAIGASNTAVTGANNSLELALALAGNANAGGVTVTRDALMATSQATQAALAAVTSSNRDSLAFASGVSRDSLGMAATINRDSLTLAERGQSLIATSAASSLNMVGNIVDLAFKANEAQSKRLADAGATANALVGRAYETATGYQAEKQTADSKYLVVAGLIAVALVAIRAFGK
ncbi:hypothetical protein RY831_27660 [Noviherbaspirillum sp. CPCC 100848]|uniref:Uncharacterized protein n=1 Tax=Noviherbaspirillum album TaxID=3080276 RepID=A0ABU6JH02_9BURK|nr:hypothetical protein [Noviherbaspirillum sp. CPCC 100848]MEC4722941.1 hypothetical protein [Noviherbaspirillum sp. CPCC 100848]